MIIVSKLIVCKQVCSSFLLKLVTIYSLFIFRIYSLFILFDYVDSN